MKDDRRLERLYAGLSAKETATLVFSHLCNGNTAEADRIRDLVPMKVYRLLDPEHTDHFERLRRATLYYGLERWHYEARCFAASGFVLYSYNSDDAEVEDRAMECFDSWKAWETRLASLDAALEAVCTKHGISAADVRRMVNTDGPYKILGPGKVDPALVADMTKTFNDILEPPG